MRILVAVPVYNEQQYVQRVIEKITRFAKDVLVVDDGSTDYTPMLLAMQPVDVVRHKRNLGYGASIQDAFRWAQTYAYDWLITMDCDEQHEPESLPAFYTAIQEDDADVISGSRYMCRERCGDPPPEDRRKINKQITELLNDRLDMHVTDAFCGYKAYRVSKLSELNLDVAGYAVPLQAWVQHAAHGHRIKEVPVKLIYNDPNRSFGGPLDNPAERLAHYLEVFEEAMAEHADKFSLPEVPPEAPPVVTPAAAGVGADANGTCQG